jgi:periplasmic copper chaperone A
MRTLPPGLLLVLSLALSSCAAPTLQVESAVLTPAIGSAPPLLHFTLRNTGSTALVLTAVSVDGADSARMQTTSAHRMPGDSAPMTQFTPLDSVVIAAGQSVRFAPGGYHVMLGRLTRPLREGDSARVTLHVAGGRAVQSFARIIPYDALDSALQFTTDAATGTPLVPTVAEGRELYLANGCASCHGRDGHGDGPIAPTLMPRPRDFRSSTPYRNGSDEAAIARTLATGIPSGGQMPLFAHLTLPERRAIAMYLLSLRPSSTPDTGS